LTRYTLGDGAGDRHHGPERVPLIRGVDERANGPPGHADPVWPVRVTSD
jgi:hypothetical protein